MWRRLIFSIAILYLTLIFFPQPTLASESPNYCLDKDSWQVWDNFVAEHYGDDDVQALHALRLGLCIKIEAGSITLDRAVTIFDTAHLQLYEKWQREALLPPKEEAMN